MKIFSTMLNGITEYMDSGVKKYHMNEGYKMTKVPELPEILENQIAFRAHAACGRRVGFTLAPNGFDKTYPSSLEFARTMLKGLFAGTPEVMELLEHPLPQNVISVGFSEYNFTVGNFCQEFFPTDNAEGFFTYQKLSPNLHATYFNKDGICFLAGVTYFPVLIGKARCYVNDRAAVQIAVGSVEPYPYQDREKSFQKVNHKNYGRFCSMVKKRVMIDCSGKYVRHVEYDHFFNCYKRTICEECIVDSVTYKWAGLKGTEEATPEAATTASTTSTPQKPEPTYIDQIASRVQKLDDHVIQVFNRNTGVLTDPSNCPKVGELGNWLKANPDFNVHVGSYLIAHLLLGEEFADRFGGFEKKENPEPKSESPVALASSPEPVVSDDDSKASGPVEDFSDPLQRTSESSSDVAVDFDHFMDASSEFDSDLDVEVINQA